MAAWVLSGLADSTPTEGKTQGCRSHLQAVPCVPKSWNRRYGSRSGSSGNPVSLLTCWTRTHQRQRDIDVDVGQTSWLSPPAAPLSMIDGGPNSEYEPERADCFYLLPPQASPVVAAASRDSPRLRCRLRFSRGTSEA